MKSNLQIVYTSPYNSMFFCFLFFKILDKILDKQKYHFQKLQVKQTCHELLEKHLKMHILFNLETLLLFSFGISNSNFNPFSYPFPSPLSPETPISSHV